MAKPKDKNSLIQDITNRYRVTAREARDIVTSVGTVMKTVANAKGGQNSVTWTGQSQKAVNAAGSDLKKQVKETINAATSGKSGTTAAQSKVKREVKPGTKR
jgi:hypothetical protein